MALQTEIANCNAAIPQVVGVNTVQTSDQTVVTGLSVYCTGVYAIQGSTVLNLQGTSVFKIG